MSDLPVAAKPGKKRLTLDEALVQLEHAARLRTELKLAFFKPYPKQLRFFELTANRREVMLMAANQYGKSDAGAFAAACHMTGLYPDWWPGRRWTRPTRGWIAGETSLVVRDVQQKKLCGEPGVKSAFGTGMIPKDCLLDVSMARGITDAYDTIQVRHKSGGVSIGRFKSYEQGRTKFQGETLDWGWPDEEPDEEVYSEFLTRIAEGGCMFMTFTPMKGRSKVVLRFLEQGSLDRAFVNATLAEAEHFSEEEKKRRMEGYLAHERDARAKGIPIMGSGAVYQFSEDLIREAPIPMEYIPREWAKLWGVDFGIDHPFAAVLSLFDREHDIIHIAHAIRLSGATGSPESLSMTHAAAMRNVAAAVPVAWPHDGTQRDKGSGEQLSKIYAKHGLSMLADHAQFEGGGYSRETAVREIAERAVTGRFKVAAHLTDWFSEFRLYHRKDGLIVPVEDDLMSATEKVIMSKRFARPVPLGAKAPVRRRQLVADGVDDNYFGLE